MGSKSEPSWNVTASSIPSVSFCEILKTVHWVRLQVRKLSEDLAATAQDFIQIIPNLTIVLQ